MASKHQMARLLAGQPGMSRPEKDAIFNEVVSQVAPRPRRWPWAAALGTAAVVAGLFVVPRLSSTPAAHDGAFTARGGSAASFSIACDGAGECNRGDRLVFDVSVGDGLGYFAAFAQRSDGLILWYFPGAAGERSLDVLAHSNDGLVERAIELDGEHEPGRYRVIGIHSERPLSRDEIKSAYRPDEASAGPGTSVTLREMVIQ